MTWMMDGWMDGRRLIIISWQYSKSPFIVTQYYKRPSMAIGSYNVIADFLDAGKYRVHT